MHVHAKVRGVKVKVMYYTLSNVMNKDVSKKSSMRIKTEWVGRGISSKKCLI